MAKQMNVLVLNPGGNSLKVEVVVCSSEQSHAFDGRKLISLSIEDIGKEPHLLVYDGKKVVSTEDAEAADYEQAAASILSRLKERDHRIAFELDAIECVGIRVVHGGPHLVAPAEMTAQVEKEITDLERLAPLHNKSSIEVLGPVRKTLPHARIYGVFDTAFHRTMPDYAARYAISD